MNTKKLTITLLLTLAFSSIAGESDATQSNPKRDEIFNAIMESLPATEKTRVTQAAAQQQKSSTKKHASRTQTTTSGTVQKQKELSAALDELPAEIRERVEKAMQEIEKGNKQRVIQFKERKKEESGE